MTRRRLYPVSQARVRAAPSLFVMLDEASKKESVLKLAGAGIGDYCIASMTGMDAGQVWRIIATHAAELRVKGEVSP